MTSQLPFFLAHIWLIPMFPLIAAAAMLFFGRRLKNDVINGLCVGSVFVSFIFSTGSFLQLLLAAAGQSHRVINVLFEWLPAVPVPHARRPPREFRRRLGLSSSTRFTQ